MSLAQIETSPCETALIAGKVGVGIAVEGACNGVDLGGGSASGIVHALLRAYHKTCELGILSLCRERGKEQQGEDMQ